jgi:hypothetical protein
MGNSMKRSKKLKANLERRRADYSRMIAQTGKDYSGYKRPGSNNQK